MSETLGEEPHTSVTVKRPERQDQYDTPEEFEEGVVGGGDLKSFETIYINVRPRDLYEDARVTVVIILFNGRAAAWMQAEGSSEVIVRGVALALQAVLEEGRRTHARWVFRIAMVVLWCGVAVSVVFDVGALEHGKHAHNGVLAIVGLSLDVLGLLLFAMWFFAFPAMELRRVGEPTRMQRLLGQPFKWLLGIIVLAGITAVIGTVLAKLI